MKTINHEAYEIAHYISDFLMSYCLLSKTVSEHTVKSYTDSLTLYLDFLESVKSINIKTISYDCFKGEFIEEWLQWLMETRNNLPQTANVRLSSIRAFLDYLSSKKIELNYLVLEAGNIKKRKTSKSKVKGMSREAVKALSTTISQTTKSGRRDLTLFTILYDTGTRIDEILSLMLKDIHMETKKPFITITGKGNKYRSLYLRNRTIEHLKRYLSEYHKDIDQCGNSYLFYSIIKGKNTMMSQPAIAKQLKKWAKKANLICKDVPIGLHAHQIRHAAATHWLEDGMNVAEIQYLLGHESIQTTMVYLEITVAQEAMAIYELMTDEEKNESKIWKDDIVRLRELCK